ncbi:MAG: sugar ABC transporter substrate-binding protein [Clostridiales bacterium]|jgi:ribose transport system substrate-binding protein|nr:sugar ABC transporter substrate-binding protein [Clostridiales bacterium]OPZ69681.1 MAG: D-ribose-binding periplasmic protein precursor [Firmicutes bacterium ADurb.Bin467]
MKKILTLLLIVSLLVPAALIATASAETKGTIGLVLGYRRDEFYMDLESRFLSAAQEAGYELLVTDTDFDIARSVAAIEDYTSMGVDAILSWGSAQFVSAIEAAVAAGIPVVCYDGSTPSELVTANVTYDPIDDGNAIGLWVKAYIEKNWPDEEVEVAILDFPASSEICVGRTNAFKAVIETIPNAKIVAQMDGKASRADSMAAAETILEAHPNVRVAYGINFDTVAGFYAALEGRGKTDCICVSSGSWGEEAINFLVEDHPQYKAFTLMNPWDMADASVQAAVDAIEGKEVVYNQAMIAKTYDASNISELDYKLIIESR